MPARPKPASSRVRKIRTRAPAQERALQTALASLAHEVRTPLNGILVLAELLAAGDLPARERAWARALKSAAEHLARFTTVVVDGARAGLGTLAPKQEMFDARALAVTLAQSLEARAAAKGLAAEISGVDDLPAQVEGDPVLLRAAVENLVDNAVKFTATGRIALHAAAEPLAGGRMRLICTVRDAGIGMTATELRRLFRPFRQANPQVARQYRGAGLGLAFARQVARAMGGDLTVASRPGEGTRFALSVEVACAPAASLSAEKESPLPGAPAVRILCAEDNPYGRVMFDTMAGALGHAMDFVTSGEAAVAAAAAGGYDLVLMDVTLAGMDGIEATRRIRALAGPAGRMPVIGISGRGDPEEERRARAAGMDDYLVKPVTPSALAAVIACAARRSRC